MNAPQSFESPLPEPPAETPLVILAEGCFGDTQSKTATGVIRYGQWPVSAVIDSSRAGATVRDVTGLACDAPVVATLREALAQPLPPKALLIGIAPKGGRLPDAWRGLLLEALEAGLHLVNGLHFFLADDAALRDKAREKNLRLWDVRNPALYAYCRDNPLAWRKPRPAGCRVVTLVGSDCSVGKMFTALALDEGMRARGEASRFLATGQTGILIAGDGVPLDRVIGDFMAGAIEQYLLAMIARQHDPAGWYFVEGQGALQHPAYSGVTLSLLHGSNPDALVLCHNPAVDTIRGGYDVLVPTLKDLVGRYESAAGWIRNPDEPKARVVGVSLNTSAYAEADAQALLRAAREETGLPAVDPLRTGVAPLLDALLADRQGPMP